jgi:hypothetical protein
MARIVVLNVRLTLLVVVMLTMLLGWTAAAHAQSSRDAQYRSPTASGEAAIAASDLSGSASASSSAGASASASGVLPSTGGPALQLAVLGGIALTSTGLLILRHNSR